VRKTKLIAVVILVVIAGCLAAIYSKTAYVVPILMYHSIDHNDKATKLSVSPESFARQMEFLHKNHYNVVPLVKVLSYIQKKEKPPRNTIAITFDDGYDNNYQYAYPLLKKYNMPAAIFIIVNSVGKPGFLSWKEIREMSDSGIITIGSHTMTHLWLLGSDVPAIKKEIADSKAILEKKLGKRVDLFCYPMGAFNARSKKAVEDAGYACAVSTNPPSAPTDRYAIKRVKISRSSDNMFIFWAETTRFYSLFKRRKETE